MSSITPAHAPVRSFSLAAVSVIEPDFLDANKVTAIGQCRSLSKSDLPVCRGTQAWTEGLSTMRLMTGKRAETLLELMHQIEYFTLARAWAALTDDEFFWEPFTTTWSVRRRDECRTSNPFGPGEWVADFEIPEPAPVPMTTIAWLYWHIGSMPGRLCDIDLLGGTRTMASGWTSPYLAHHPIFTSAAEAVSASRDGWQRLRGAIEQADDDQLEVTTAGYTYAAEPPRGGLCVVGPPGPAHPATHFIAATLNEVGHHGSQIGALRDAYAWRRSTAPVE
jgi:DinB superfamily